MIELVKGRVLRCELSGKQTANRCIGICYLEGADVAVEMMSAGKARNCPKLSAGRYRDAELKSASAGVRIGRADVPPGYCRVR